MDIMRDCFANAFVDKLRQMGYDAYVLKKGLCKENPLEGIIIRSRERDDSERDTLALTPELRATVLDKLETEPILKPILTVLMLTGMRPGDGQVKHTLKFFKIFFCEWYLPMKKAQPKPFTRSAVLL